MVDTSKLPDLATIDPETCYLSWTMKLETVKGREVVDAVFEFVREDSLLTIEEVEAKVKVEEDSRESSQTARSALMSHSTSASTSTFERAYGS